jgi:hypothetical protein
MTPPNLAMAREVLVPPLGNMETDEGQDEVGD